MKYLLIHYICDGTQEFRAFESDKSAQELMGDLKKIVEFLIPAYADQTQRLNKLYPAKDYSIIEEFWANEKKVYDKVQFLGLRIPLSDLVILGQEPTVDLQHFEIIELNEFHSRYLAGNQQI